MFYSPKPELIFDTNHMAVGIKDKDDKLIIYADKMHTFNRTYWANWFGQKDSMVLPLKDNIFITNHGQKIIINKNNYCKDAEIHINLNYKAKCKGSLITINHDFFKKVLLYLSFAIKRNVR